jgi:hypothetical protein
MLRAILAHPQEALHNRDFIYCARVMSVSCTTDVYTAIRIMKIIIIFINCKWVNTHPVAVVNSHITYARTIKVDYCGFSWGWLHGKHVAETGKGKTGTIPAFALGPRKTKKNLCRDGRSQDIPVTDC